MTLSSSFNWPQRRFVRTGNRAKLVYQPDRAKAEEMLRRHAASAHKGEIVSSCRGCQDLQKKVANAEA